MPTLKFYDTATGGYLNLVGSATGITQEYVDAGDAANQAHTDSRIWYGTFAEYNAIGTKDPTVLYVVTG